MEALVTIIVPIYNVEKYLDRCMYSVANQTYQNLEIILVDDGSPDNCPQICDRWAAQDSRIKVIHKQNEGLGMARNTGLDHATGAYVYFVDSDDYIELNLIESAYCAAKENDADMVCFGMNFINTAGEKIWSRSPVKHQIYHGQEVLDDFLPKMVGADPETGEEYGFSMSASTELFSMRSIRKNNWRFISEREMISEDFYSILKLCADVQTVCALPVPFYNYCQNDSSVSRAYCKERFNRLCSFHTEIQKACSENGYNPQVAYRFGWVYLAAVMSVLKQEAAYESSIRKRIKAIARILDNEQLQRVLDETKKDKAGIQQKVLFWAMRHHLVALCYGLLAGKNMLEANRKIGKRH